MSFTSGAAKKSNLAPIIIGGFLVIIFFVGGLFAFGFFSLYQQNKQLKNNTYVRGFKVAIISDMLSANNERSNIALRLQSNKGENIEAIEFRYEVSSNNFSNAVEGLQDLDDGFEQKKLMESILEKNNKTDDLYEKIKIQFNNEKYEVEQVELFDEILLSYQELDQSIKQLLEYEQVGWFRDVATTIDFNEKQYRVGLYLLTLVLFFSVMVAWRVLHAAKRAERRLLKQKEYAQATLISLADGVITVDAKGRVRQINNTAQKITGWSEQSAIGKKLADVYQSKSLVTGMPIEHPVSQAHYSEKVSFPNIHYLLSKQKKIYEVETSYSIVSYEEAIAGAVIIFRDISESQEMSRKLKWQAQHDSLTGLINRNSFEDNIQNAIRGLANKKEKFALLFLDLDQFKIVNDTCGHIAGDALLTHVGMIFEQQVRKTDVLARLGGDEFGVLIYDCDEGLAYTISEKLLDAVNKFRFSWEEKIFSIGASIGFVIVESEAASLSEIMSAADMACYAAKEAGRGRVKKYNKEISTSANEMSLSTKIKQALDNNDFVLYAQEIMPISEDLPDEKVYEILIRMNNDGELSLPNSFLPAAERFNLMISIDLWVITNLFEYLREVALSKQSSRSCRYAINLSGASINDDQFFDKLRDKIDEYAIPTNLLCFEITETVAITNLNKAAGLIQRIKELGCLISLDDFGTGASSFAYLKYLPVDYLKIDGTFIKGIVEDSLDQEIVKSIVNIAKILSIKTVAEFVENDQILQRVKALGIDYSQGYEIGYPKPLPDLLLDLAPENSLKKLPQG